MDDRALMRLHVQALFTYDSQGRMCRVNEPNGAAAPRFFMGRTVAGNEWRFRHDLPIDLVNELDLVSRSEVSGIDTDPAQVNTAAYVDVLDPQGLFPVVWTGPTFRFDRYRRESTDVVLITRDNADLLRPNFESWLEEMGYRQPFFAVVKDDAAVSVCCSVRITPAAHEAGVETAAESRGRGYGAAVVAHWAQAVNEMGAVPLYSTSWHNTASRALARALGMLQYGSVMHFA